MRRTPLGLLTLFSALVALSCPLVAHAASDRVILPHAASKAGIQASFATVTDSLQAGDQAEISIHVAAHAKCSLLLHGPDKAIAGPYNATFTEAFGVWRWRVPSDVRGGTWLGTVACRIKNHTLKKLTTRISAAVTATNHSSVVAKRSMTTSGTPRAPLTVVADVAGKGGGGAYPDDGAKCKWGDAGTATCHNADKSSYYDWGYLNANGTWRLLSDRLFAYRNCTDYVAWVEGLTWSSFKFPAGLGHARDWKDYAKNAGLEVTDTPSVGDVAWWGQGKVGGTYGHVAVVTAVNADGSVTVSQYNAVGTGKLSTGLNMHAEKYLHKPSAPTFDPSKYVGHIVQWSGDLNPQKAAWLVIDAAGHRNWIPTAAIYNCLKGKGAPGPDLLPASALDQLPDQHDVWAVCTSSGGKGAGGPDTTAPSPPGAPQASAATVSALTLSWTPSTDDVGVAGYNVYLNGVVVTTTSGTSFGFSGLTCGTSYTLGIAGYDAAGNLSSVSSVPASTTSCPVASIIFPVMNTSETPPDGVWFRSSPHTADTPRITGLGVYANEQVQLHCYGWGDSVGAYNDTLWYYVTDVSRPTNNGQPNTGWLNAHYINDGKVANVVDAGVPAC